MSIGEKIKKYRKQRGLTQKELAEKCNISRSYLADLERDRYNPSLETLKVIAKNLNINLSDLLEENEKETNAKLDFDLGSVKLNKIARYAKDLTETEQETVLNVIEALRRARLENDKNDDPDEI